MRVFSAIITMLLTLCVLTGCDSGVRHRPNGILRVGKVADMLQPETYLKEYGIMMRYDASGLSAMSTYCTHDISPLSRRGDTWVSSYSTSSYSTEGAVLSGPAIAPLPYYELRIDQGVAGGPVDTVYIEVGRERPKEWRLPWPPK